MTRPLVELKTAHGSFASETNNKELSSRGGRLSVVCCLLSVVLHYPKGGEKYIGVCCLLVCWSFGLLSVVRCLLSVVCCFVRFSLPGVCCLLFCIILKVGKNIQLSVVCWFFGLSSVVRCLLSVVCCSTLSYS